MDQSNTPIQLHFVKVVVWKRDKILVEFHPETNLALKYDLPTFLVGSKNNVHDFIRDEMRKAFRMSVGDVVDTGIKSVSLMAPPAVSNAAETIIEYLACDYQSYFKDTLLTVEPPASVWMPARVAHALFLKHQSTPNVHGAIGYLEKFL